MTANAETQVRAKVWLKPNQVDRLRTACYEVGATFLQQRNEAIIALLYDSGLRVGELVALDVDLLRDGNTELYLPAEIQKDYPNENSPKPVPVGLKPDTARLLTSYLTNRWKDSPAVFPSRSSGRITTEGIRQMVRKIAVQAEIRPYNVDGSRGGPEDVTPHALRHSVAYRMLSVEDDNEFYDVRKRLRHERLATTEQVYDHFDRV